MKPRVGQWYETGQGERFQVVAYDEEYGGIGLQYEDSAIGELDISDWEDNCEDFTLVDAPLNGFGHG